MRTSRRRSPSSDAATKREERLREDEKRIPARDDAPRAMRMQPAPPGSLRRLHPRARARLLCARVRFRLSSLAAVCRPAGGSRVTTTSPPSARGPPPSVVSSVVSSSPPRRARFATRVNPRAVPLRGAPTRRESGRDGAARCVSKFVAPCRQRCGRTRRTPTNTRDAVLPERPESRRPPEHPSRRPPEHPSHRLAPPRRASRRLLARARPRRALRVGGVFPRARETFLRLHRRSSRLGLGLCRAYASISSRRRARRVPAPPSPPASAAAARSRAFSASADAARRRRACRRRRGLDVTTRRRARAKRRARPPPRYSPNFGRRFDPLARGPGGAIRARCGDARRPDDYPRRTSKRSDGVNARRRDAARSAARRRAHARFVADAKPTADPTADPTAEPTAPAFLSSDGLTLASPRTSFPVFAPRFRSLGRFRQRSVPPVSRSCVHHLVRLVVVRPRRDAPLVRRASSRRKLFEK